MINISDFKEKFEPRVQKAMTKNLLPGFSITLSKNNEIFYSQGFGARDIKQSMPFTPDTINGFGSCTKSMTSLAILILANEDKLNVNDPVSNYLPFKLGIEDHPITIHHLMTHSSGMPSLGSAELSFQQAYPFDIGYPPIPFTNWNDFYLHVNQAQDELYFKPGEHFHYNNAGYTMLGQIIESVSEMSFIEFIKKEILSPLEMNRSGFYREKMEKDKNWSIPYIMVPGDEKPVITPAVFPFNDFIYAPGGLISSTNEMMKYIQMMINDGKVKGNQLFEPEMIQETYKKHFKERDNPMMSSFGESSYGYGWGITENFFGNDIVMHGGGIIGGISFVGFIKEKRIGFTAIGNSDGFPSMELFAALALLLDKDPDEEISFIKRTNHLNELCGNYASFGGINQVTIVNKGGILFVENKKQSYSIPIIPQDDSTTPMEFYLINQFGAKMPVVFRENNGIQFIYERNQFRKNS
jgi:CubicO group peptidase (beta-lactamase class C family)